MRHRRLIDITNLTVNDASVGTYGGHIKVLDGSCRYHALLQDFRDLIRSAGIRREPRHCAVYHIRTTSGTTCNFAPAATSTGSPPNREIRVRGNTTKWHRSAFR